MLAVVAMKVGIYVQGNVNKTPQTEHTICKQQQIAAGNKLINKANVYTYIYLMLAVVAMKVLAIYVQGNATNTPKT